MKGKFKFLLLILLVLYLIMEIFFPLLVERNLHKNIVENIDSVQSLEINANSFPAWEMILSKIDRVEIEARKLSLDGLLIDSISTKHRDVYINEDRIMGKNKDLQFIVSEQAVNDYITKKYPDLSNFRIKFTPEQAYLSGEIDFFNRKINIQMTGSFNLKENNIIYFYPVNLKIEKLEIPGEVINKFVEDTGFAINLNKLNMPLNVEKIKIDNSCIYLLGGIYARKAGF